MAREQQSYFASIWRWLRDDENRKVVAWIGSGLVVAVGALVYQNSTLGPASGTAHPAPPVNVTVGEGVGVGGSMQLDGDLTVGSGQQGDAETPQR